VDGRLTVAQPPAHSSHPASKTEAGERTPV
jgi:hypothetical protein